MSDLMNMKEGDKTIKDFIISLINLFAFVIRKIKIIILVALIGGGIAVGYSLFQKPIYIATFSFALEDEKSGGGGLSGALGLASSLGLDIGSSAGGAFTGQNLMELIKSRTVIEKALLNPISIEGKSISLLSYYIKFKELDKKWTKNAELSKIRFDPYMDRSKFNFKQDSIVGEIYEDVSKIGGILNILQKEKKSSIIQIEVRSTNELFSKNFAESIASVVSDFYIQTKSKKAAYNVAILQKQVDSVRAELNFAITGVAVANENTFNLNSALIVKRVPSSKKQIDVQANTAILTQLVTNLELAKVSLLKETPLIQVIDRPILPLKKERLGKAKSLVIGAFLSGLFATFFLIARDRFTRIMNSK
jgi:capsular polysaccharide biosynthesis protein